LLCFIIVRTEYLHHSASFRHTCYVDDVMFDFDDVLVGGFEYAETFNDFNCTAHCPVIIDNFTLWLIFLVIIAPYEIFHTVARIYNLILIFFMFTCIIIITVSV